MRPVCFLVDRCPLAGGWSLRRLALKSPMPVVVVPVLDDTGIAERRYQCYRVRALAVDSWAYVQDQDAEDFLRVATTSLATSCSSLSFADLKLLEQLVTACYYGATSVMSETDEGE